MTRVIKCPVCGRQECGLHDSVLAFAQFLDRCALVGVSLLTGLIVLAVAFAAL
jgi:4-hydroxy-3-methylbut-2-en-1-yl diphosphate synthase IspG/GcpE